MVLDIRKLGCCGITLCTLCSKDTDYCDINEHETTCYNNHEYPNLTPLHKALLCTRICSQKWQQISNAASLFIMTTPLYQLTDCRQTSGQISFHRGHRTVEISAHRHQYHGLQMQCANSVSCVSLCVCLSCHGLCYDI